MDQEKSQVNCDLDLEAAIRIAKIISTAPAERMPMITDLFRQAGLTLSGLEELIEGYGARNQGNLIDTSEFLHAQCTVNGVVGNDFTAGQINILCDPVNYVASVSNTDITAGGADLETDEALAERVFLAPSSYSVAGPEDAYVYWAKTYNASIGSVKVVSATPCDVVVYILMVDGDMPGAEIINGLTDYLQDENIRPLTDHVTVSAPTAQTFTVEITYYINRSNSSSASTIQAEVENAVADYVAWQTTDIGKDINPSELIKRVVNAGAKRVEVTTPVFTAVGVSSAAQLSGSAVIHYGGLEDD